VHLRGLRGLIHALPPLAPARSLPAGGWSEARTKGPDHQDLRERERPGSPAGGAGARQQGSPRWYRPACQVSQARSQSRVDAT